ncbi:MAG: hypothetical protein KF779_05960 [Hyphomonadaceae bacterium]|nr:hypothetical protein [Hyphomonadaceae bacterium]
MVMLVHLAPAKLEARIRRSGVKPGDGLFDGGKSAVIYAFPVLPSYTVTHQWTREIMKWRRQPMVGVYFRLRDDEDVEFGHYNKLIRRAPASVAAGEIGKAEDPRGWQIMVPRSILAKEIVRVAPVRGVTGWRHMPDAHNRKPCGCPACMARGEPGGRRIRLRYDRGEL